MNAWYDMNRVVRSKVKEWAREEGWPEPCAFTVPILTALIVGHKLSLIADEMDGIINALNILSRQMQGAIEEGNAVAVMLIKERLDEEKKKLAHYERLLGQEGPTVQTPKKDAITDEMILRAREYPFESLLPTELRRGRCACPIHNGKNSLSFSVKDNRGFCFACGWKGDPIDYVMITEGYTFPQAVRRLQ